MAKQVYGRSVKKNGFGLIYALNVFLLCLLVCSFFAVSASSKGWLLKAQKQSTFDLALIEKARQLAWQTQMVRKCHPQSDTHEILWQTIAGKEVKMECLDTCIEMSWVQGSKKIKARLYFSSAGTEGLEYIRKAD